MDSIAQWFTFGRLRRKTRILALFAAAAFVVMLHYILSFESSVHETVFSDIDIDIPSNFVPKLVTEREKLPSRGELRIPKIIHQTWKTTEIPNQFVPWIKTWTKQHPDWEYWFWTDDSAEQLIAERYPDFLDTFRGYTQPIRRADAFRYIVLYEFGGVYADLDMEALTPLDPLAMKYSCFIGQEPYAHPVLDTNFEQLLINALMGCKKGHPFMKLLVDSLPKFAMFWDFLDSTGPHFVTHIYRQYISEDTDGPGEDSYVYVTPSEYFYPTMDPEKIQFFVNKCNNGGYLSHIQMEACRNLKYKHLPENKFDATSIAFTNHHWYHTYLKNMYSLIKTRRSINEIVPSVKIFTPYEH